ncbi:MAG: hypothetical protein PUB07_02540 [Clostridia bacterium]|nr:hypothetical protein [Clostridia bacterium]
MIIVKGRHVMIPEEERTIGWMGDHAAQTVQFCMVDTSLADCSFRIDVAQKEKNMLLPTMTVQENGIFLSWEVQKEHLQTAGEMQVQIRAFRGTAMVWHSEVFTLWVESSIQAEAAFSSPLPSAFSTLEANVAQLADETAASANTAAASAETASASAFAMQEALDNCVPIVGDNGNWFLWDIETGGYVDSGKPSRGVQGEQGIQGVQGIQGIQGERGLQGVQGVQGERGERGERGEQGIQGERGLRGEQGIQGIQGKPFGIAKIYSSIPAMQEDYATADVNVGDFVLISTGNVEDEDNAKLYVKDNTGFSYITDLSGSAGIQGEQGIQGVQGQRGEKGEKGDKGDKGDTGPQGIQGIQGVQGEQGLQGIQGERGEQGIQGERGFSGLNPLIQVPYAASLTVSANTMTYIAELAGDISITLGDSVPDYDNEWAFSITQGQTAYEVTLPTVNWQAGIAPVFAANTTTEIRLYYIGSTLKGVWIQ